MHEPQVILTERYCSDMERDKTVARKCVLLSEGGCGLCVRFQLDGGHIPFQRVAIPQSVYEKALSENAETLFAVEQGSGDVFEFNIHDIQEKLYEVDFGEEMFCIELREAKHMWPDLGNDMYTNDSFFYP